MIEFRGVSFDYGGSAGGGLRDISLRIETGECVLLCGASGCGKTTLTRLINGLIPHFFRGSLRGTVLVDGADTAQTDIASLSDRVGTVFQNPRTQFFNIDTDSELVFGLENRAVPRDQLRRRLEELTEELGLHGLRGRSIFELSGGEKQKIAFSSVYASEPSVFVLDEPSSNLDSRSIAELTDLIRCAKASGKTIVLAEHRLWYLMDIADRVVFLRDGRIERDMEIAAFRALSDTETAEMGLRCRSLSGLAPEGISAATGDRRLSVENLSLRRSGAPVLSGLSFEIRGGEIVALAGGNGSGKTSLARVLCGLQKEASGRVCLASGSGPGHALTARQRQNATYMVMQDVGHQLFTETVADECRLGVRRPDEALIDSVLELLELGAYRERHPLSLSGGQKQRLAVAVSLVCGRDLVIFDEPTSGLDLRSMRAVGELSRRLAEQGRILLIATHDVEFMMSICTRILYLSEGCIAADLEGEDRGRIDRLLRGGAAGQ